MLHLYFTFLCSPLQDNSYFGPSTTEIEINILFKKITATKALLIRRFFVVVIVYKTNLHDERMMARARPLFKKPF